MFWFQWFDRAEQRVKETWSKIDKLTYCTRTCITGSASGGFRKRCKVRARDGKSPTSGTLGASEYIWQRSWITLSSSENNREKHFSKQQLSTRLQSTLINSKIFFSTRVLIQRNNLLRQYYMNIGVVSLQRTFLMLC